MLNDADVDSSIAFLHVPTPIEVGAGVVPRRRTQAARAGTARHWSLCFGSASVELCSNGLDNSSVEPRTGPAEGDTYTITGSGRDDTGDTVLFSFSANDGQGTLIEVGPQESNVAEIELAAGRWTLRVTVDDDPDCADEAFDSTCVQQLTSGRGLFNRGDANADSATDIADPVYVLNHLFGGGPIPSCMQTADANDDNVVDISDPVYQLNHLFGGGPPLSSPVGKCGADPTPAANAEDDLSCEAYPPCKA